MDFALGAAVIAGVVMEGLVYMQKAMKLPVKQNIVRTWGQDLLRVPGPGVYVPGLVFHQGSPSSRHRPL